MRIAILEDDDRRIERMRAVLASICPRHEAFFFYSAPDLIDWLQDNLDRLDLISLDHDLMPPLEEGAPSRDVGTGRDVADFLSRQKPASPVIVHTSNSLAAPVMEGTLTGSGWEVKRVVPFLDLEWIDSAWLVCVARTAGQIPTP